MHRTALPVLALLLGLCGSGMGARAGTATADNVVVAAGGLTYRIAHVEATDTALDNAALAHLLDPASAEPLSQRLAALSAGGIAMPEVVAETRREGVTETVIYRDVKLGDVKAGHVGTLSIAGASLAAATPRFDDLRGVIGPMTASDVDLAQLARVASVPRTDPAEPRKPLYGSYAVTRVTVASVKAGFDLSVGPISGGGARGRALETPLTMLAAALAPKPDETPEAARTRATHVLIDVLGSLEVGAFEAKELKVRSTQADKPATFALARIAIGDAGGDRLGSVSLEGLALETPQVTLRLGSIGLQNIDLAAVRTALAAAETGAADPTAASVPPQPAPGLLTLSDLSAEVGANGDGNAADGQRTAFHIDRIAMTGAHVAAAAPVEVGTELDHFAMALPSQADGTLQNMVAMGYSKLDLSSRLGVAWDEARKELQVKTISLTGDGMGTLTVSALFGNVSKDLFSSDPAVMQAAAFGMLLNKIDLRIDNGGLIDKAMALQARSEGKSVDEVRKTYVTGAGVAVPVMLGNGPGAKAIGAALAKFAAQPRSLHLVATAPNGLGASDLEALGDPAALLAKLAIQASANE